MAKLRAKGRRRFKDGGDASKTKTPILSPLPELPLEKLGVEAEGVARRSGARITPKGEIYRPQSYQEGMVPPWSPPGTPMLPTGALGNDKYAYYPANPPPGFTTEGPPGYTRDEGRTAPSHMVDPSLWQQDISGPFIPKWPAPERPDLAPEDQPGALQNIESDPAKDKFWDALRDQFRSGLRMAKGGEAEDYPPPPTLEHDREIPWYSVEPDKPSTTFEPRANAAPFSPMFDPSNTAGEEDLVPAHTLPPGRWPQGYEPTGNWMAPSPMLNRPQGGSYGSEDLTPRMEIPRQLTPQEQQKWAPQNIPSHDVGQFPGRMMPPRTMHPERLAPGVKPGMMAKGGGTQDAADAQAPQPQVQELPRAPLPPTEPINQKDYLDTLKKLMGMTELGWARGGEVHGDAAQDREQMLGILREKKLIKKKGGRAEFAKGGITDLPEPPKKIPGKDVLRRAPLGHALLPVLHTTIVIGVSPKKGKKKGEKKADGGRLETSPDFPDTPPRKPRAIPPRRGKTPRGVGKALRGWGKTGR